MTRLTIGMMLMFFVSACSQNSGSEVSEEKSDSTAEVTAGERNEHGQILADYMEIKNALVGSDAEKAATAAGRLAKADEAGAEITGSAAKIAENADLEYQREEFFKLSGFMYEHVKNSENQGETVYWQHCPMAFDNSGANWLSMESDIRNPYFGDAMLTCGMVEEEL